MIGNLIRQKVGILGQFGGKMLIRNFGWNGSTRVNFDEFSQQGFRANQSKTEFFNQQNNNNSSDSDSGNGNDTGSQNSGKNTYTDAPNKQGINNDNHFILSLKMNDEKEKIDFNVSTILPSKEIFKKILKKNYKTFVIFTLRILTFFGYLYKEYILLIWLYLFL